MKLSDKAKQVIKAVAPTLATALGGPLAGAAAKIILGKFGGEEDQIGSVLEQADPTTLLALKKAEQEFIVQMKELDISEEKLHAEDRASARAREVALRGDTTTRILAYTIVGSFCTLVFAVLFGEISAESTIAGAVIGYLSAKAEQVVAYYFGSSLGSKMKTDIMGKKE